MKKPMPKSKLSSTPPMREEMSDTERQRKRAKTVMRDTDDDPKFTKKKRK